VAKKAVTALTVVLNLNSSSVPAVLSRGNAIVTAMGANTGTFKSPTPALAVVTGHLTTLSTAEAALKARTGTRADRDTQLQLVVDDLHQLHTYVQQLATASPSQAANIAADASMSLRKTSPRHKSDLAASQEVSGTVKVASKAVAGGKSYEWQYSTDGGKTWLAVSPTTQAKVAIPNLQPGVTTAFRSRAVTKSGPTDWSDPVTIVVT
jgi:hypothetical protein